MISSKRTTSIRRRKMPTPISATLESGTTQATGGTTLATGGTTVATVDGRHYESITPQTSVPLIGSVGATPIASSTGTIVIHGVGQGTITFPYDCEKEARRQANR